jgi:hypothetical protein
MTHLLPLGNLYKANLKSSVLLYQWFKYVYSRLTDYLYDVSTTGGHRTCFHFNPTNDHTRHMTYIRLTAVVHTARLTLLLPYYVYTTANCCELYVPGLQSVGSI